ncbi:MAG: NusG domain II-containing protein [Treponema sp.]|jgi:hypothetical protein|nr:NusG domain II-containing protein [Treponema sp.]
MRLRPVDFALFALTLGCVLFWAVRVYGTSVPGVRLAVRSGKTVWVYPLDREDVVEIPGPLGNTVLELQKNGARIVSSPCANQTCLAAGIIRRRGQWIACLPNGVFLSVEETAPAGTIPQNAASGGGEDPRLDAAVW